MKKHETVTDYITMEDLKEKLGYTTPKNLRVGNLGYALLEASKNHRSIKWLKEHLDSYFDKLREEKQQRKKKWRNKNKHKKK